MLLISEPNKRLCERNAWLTDARLDAAIVFQNKEIAVHGVGSGDGFAWAELSNLIIYSCYCSPNVDIQHFEEFLTGLDRDIKTRKKQVVIGGDFNAKATEWGSPIESIRGRLLTDWLSEANLVVLDQGNRPTFVRYKQQSYIDITEDVSRNIKNWRVVDDETLRWHRIIEFEYLEWTREVSRVAAEGWRINEESIIRFREKFATITKRETEAGGRPHYEKYIEMVTKCCDEVFPRKNTGHGKRKGAYWWCQEVKERRKACIRARRRMTREHRCGTEESKAATVQEYKKSKKEYNREINLSKKKSWLKLLEDLDTDEWGQGYRLVVKKTGLKGENRMSEEQQMAIARKLFPAATDDVGRKVPAASEPSPFTTGELQQALNRIRNGKAPGPDGVLPEIAMAAVQSGWDIYLDIANEALRKDHFPEQMKEARLALISKNPGSKTQEAM